MAPSLSVILVINLWYLTCSVLEVEYEDPRNSQEPPGIPKDSKGFLGILKISQEREKRKAMFWKVLGIPENSQEFFSRQPRMNIPGNSQEPVFQFTMKIHTLILKNS